MVLLDVLSWEERARILTKVWIAGIVLALCAVIWYIWLQYNRKKKLKRLHERRGMTPKQKTQQQITYEITLAEAASEEVRKKLKLKHKAKVDTSLSYAYTQRGNLILAGLSMSQETTKKVFLHSLYVHQETDQRALHWLLKQLVADLKSQNFESLTYRVREKDPDAVMDMLESFGFKRVALAKKERKKFKYALKLFI